MTSNLKSGTDKETNENTDREVKLVSQKNRTKKMQTYVKPY